MLYRGQTDECVESTMRHAYEKRFDVFTLKDATTTTDLDKHEQTINQNYALFSNPLTSQECI